MINISSPRVSIRFTSPLYEKKANDNENQTVSLSMSNVEMLCGNQISGCHVLCPIYTGLFGNRIRNCPFICTMSTVSLTLMDAFMPMIGKQGVYFVNDVYLMQ